MSSPYSHWWYTEYCDDIIEVLREKEKDRMCFKYQSPQIEWRQYFVNFIRDFGCDMHSLSRTTIHLAVYILDMFMDNHSIMYDRMHLVAVNSCWLAAKIEEIDSNVPRISQFNAVLDVKYPVSDYLKLEKVMIAFFKWDLLVPTAATFLEYFIEKVINDNEFSLFNANQSKPKEVVAFSAMEYLDLSLLDCNILYKELPSKLASACIAAARHSHNLNFWTKELEELTTYSQKDVETCMLNLLTFKIDLQTGAEVSDVDNNLVIVDQNHAGQNNVAL